MDKIASPAELRAELQRILAYASSGIAPYQGRLQKDRQYRPMNDQALARRVVAKYKAPSWMVRYTKSLAETLIGLLPSPSRLGELLSDDIDDTSKNHPMTLEASGVMAGMVADELQALGADPAYVQAAKDVAKRFSHAAEREKAQRKI